MSRPRLILPLLVGAAALGADAALAAAQDTLSLPALQEAALARDPRTRQLALEEAATALRLRSLAAERLPQVTLNGEATHQSEVGSIPVEIPNAAVPEPPANRLEAALNATLRLYDGGSVSARRAAERAELAVRRAEVAAELYPARAEVAEAYFSALLLQERLRETAILVEDLEARLAMVRAQVRAGAALPGDTAALLAEVLGAGQRREELAADRRAALDVLAERTGRALDGEVVLRVPALADEVERVRPGAPGAGVPEGLRAHPRYAVFAARRAGLERQAAVVRARSLPQASAFGKLAYGRPGLAQFTDRLHEYWLAGVRVQWTPWDWGANRREREVLRLQGQVLDTEEAAFTESLRRQVRRPLRTLERLRGALETDERIIALREQVARQARAQFAERAITAAAYVDALTDLEEARVSRLRHRVELARARADYLTILGVELR